MICWLGVSMLRCNCGRNSSESPIKSSHSVTLSKVESLSTVSGWIPISKFASLLSTAASRSPGQHRIAISSPEQCAGHVAIEKLNFFCLAVMHH